MSDTRTFRDSVAAYFRRYPNKWIGSIELEHYGGRCAWRTRVSECRVQLGMTIENRVRTVTREDGSAFRVSEYLFVPAVDTSAFTVTADGQSSFL